MNIVVIGDIHGDVENILSFLDKIKELNFDVIVCPGDFTDVNVPKGFTQESLVELIIEELKTLNKPIVAVPGNIDTKNSIKILERVGVSVHGRGKIIDGVGFYGYGGAKTPFKTSIEPSEKELKVGLDAAFKEVEGAEVKIQVTHNPPRDTKLDVIQIGTHVGSEVVRRFIETYKPNAAISAHIHEARGTDELAGTKLINPGKFSEGYFGLVKLDKGSAYCKILNLIG